MKKILIYLFFPVILVACAETEEPLTLLETELLVLKISPKTLSGIERGIVMTHTEEGIPISYSDFTNGSSINLEVEKNRKYSLTVLKSIKEPSGRIIIKLETYALMNDRQVTIGLESHDRVERLSGNGSFFTYVTHHSELSSCMVSTDHGILSHMGTANSKNVYAETVFFPSPAVYLLTAKAMSGEIGYKFFNRPDKSSYSSYDFSDLDHFDKEISIRTKDFQRFNYKTANLKKDAGYWQYQYVMNHGQIGNNPYPMAEHTKLGYLNQFDLYETIVSAEQNAFESVGFHKIGLAPESIQMPAGYKIVFESNPITAFRFSTNFPYNRWKASYIHFPAYAAFQLNWEVFGEGNHLNIKSFHPEIINQEPELKNIAIFKLSNVTAIKGDKSYSKILAEKFQNPDPVQQFEYSWIKRTVTN